MATKTRKRPKRPIEAVMLEQYVVLVKFLSGFLTLARDALTDYAQEKGITLEQLGIVAGDTFVDVDEPSPELARVKVNAPNGATVHGIEAWGESSSSSELDKGAISPAPAISDDESRRSPRRDESSSEIPPGRLEPLQKGAREILRVLVAAGEPLTPTRIGTLTNLKHTTGSFGTYMSTLKTRGLVGVVDGKIAITNDGLAEAKRLGAEKATGDALAELWRTRLDKGPKKILEALRCVYPYALTRTQIGTLARLKSTTGSFGTYLSKLRSNHLIEDASIDGIDSITLTKDGLAVAGGKPTEKVTSTVVREKFTEALTGKGAARRIYELLVRADGKELTYDEIGDALDLSPDTGSFGTYLSTLRSNGLITAEKKIARARAW
jgi:hypothetical protein